MHTVAINVPTRFFEKKLNQLPKNLYFFRNNQSSLVVASGLQMIAERYQSD